ncbi:MFS transporter [Demequina sp. NBRC 110055]|uniref:MFS transporter n=1 Tax=Demequina sp. NBRC 110055 TaxID=1570344 RepID=UPI0013563461|nr:MFS transporter [Demequina sp. NBRC 110055]
MAGGTARSLFGLPAVFWVIWSAILVLWTGRFVVPFLSTYLVTGRALEIETASLVVSAYGAGGVVASLLGGPLSDRVGRLPVILVSFVGSAVLLLAVPLAPGLPSLVVVLLAYGMAGHLGGPALGALIADHVAPERRQRAYVLQVWAINLGFAIGPIVAIRLERVSFTLIFVVEAAVCAVVAASLAVALRERRIGPARWAAPAVPSPQVAGSAEGLVTGTRARGHYRQALRDRHLVTLVTLMLAYTVVYTQWTSTMPLAMTGQGLSLGTYAMLLTVNGVLLCLLQLPAMAVVERLPSSVAVGSGIALTGAGFALLTVAHSAAAHVAAIVIITLGELVTFPLAAAMVASLAPPRLRGTYQGLSGLTWSGSHAIGPALGGWILARGGAATLWAVAAAVLAAVAVAMFVTSRGREVEIAARLGRERVSVEETTVRAHPA